MPWTMKDAVAKTKQANTAAKRRKWSAIANNVLKRTRGNDVAAIKIANAAMRKSK